ncbi:hypothetical protein [Fluoribacter gormanii]|uniref:Uncharacterized protein n=1 Tax=Fluoribacter gormanii TaxID=464 RepID=A0A377GFR7_9GAMM|nr:hypothetical protein [Fluoribacter gormanii]KTD02429.1 hypothetical protein Lgor_1721 [Fluoribacter gormanii]SIR68508.1 hypothetical protein SAMN05421777_11928 [Fluoribacter gormanii]STO23669.1 Uncharacterised protein [Fluoribacter gormanii]
MNEDEIKERSISKPTEMMILRPRQELCDRVIEYTIKMYGRNLRSQIEELAAAPNRWLSIAYPISKADTNSPEARARIMGGLAIICYLNDLKAVLNTEVCFDFGQLLKSIDDYFEVTQCVPYIEEFPDILKHQPVFYEPGMNRDVVMSLIYPKEELVKRVATFTGLTMEENVLKHIAQPVLMDGKQDRVTIAQKCMYDYQKPIIYEMIGIMIALTLMNSEQKLEFQSAETYAKWTDQLIDMAAGSPSVDVVVNASNGVFWLPDPAEFR